VKQISFVLYRFSNYNGGGRKVAFSGHDYVPYSLGVGFIDGYIIWSDFTNHSIIRADALNGSNKHVLVPNTINEVMTLTIIHPSLQPEGNTEEKENKYFSFNYSSKSMWNK
jgi:hypothetical protein